MKIEWKGDQAWTHDTVVYLGQLNPLKYPTYVGWTVYITVELSAHDHPAEKINYATREEAKTAFEEAVTLLLITKRIMS